MAILKKAQVETFGLLIIVIMIVFIAIFAIKLALLSSNPEPNIRDNIVANNLAISITKVTICEKQQLNSILKNCYNNKESCNQDSCQLLARELSSMMISSGFKNDDYRLIMAIRDQNELVNIGSCNLNEKDVISSSPYPIFLGDASADLKIFLCR